VRIAAVIQYTIYIANRPLSTQLLLWTLFNYCSC